METSTRARVIEEIGARLSERAEDAAPVLAQVLPLVQRLLHADHGLSYEVTPHDAVLSLGFVHAVGFDGGAFKRDLDPLVRRMPVGWGHYNALSPEPSQRNRALEQEPAILRRLRTKVPELAQRMARDPWLAEERQLRILSCDGPSLLAWFGVFRREPFREGERRLLQRFAHPLRERLAVERHLAFAPVALQALDAALEAVGAPAFILRGAGEVAHANGAGRALLDAGPPTTREALRTAALGLGGGFHVSRLASSGAAGFSLAIASAERRDPTPRVAALGERWALTGPLRSVLARAARGESNKAIAGALRCGESTVELHVTALMRAAEVTSRSALVARFWSADVDGA